MSISALGCFKRLQLLTGDKRERTKSWYTFVEFSHRQFYLTLADQIPLSSTQCFSHLTEARPLSLSSAQSRIAPFDLSHPPPFTNTEKCQLLGCFIAHHLLDSSGTTYLPPPAIRRLCWHCGSGGGKSNPKAGGCAGRWVIRM